MRHANSRSASKLWEFHLNPLHHPNNNGPVPTAAAVGTADRKGETDEERAIRLRTMGHGDAKWEACSTTRRQAGSLPHGSEIARLFLFVHHPFP